MTTKIFVTDTILRDAHQSLLATRMRTEDMLPICDKLDKVGYWSLEVWGGATFDACVRFLKEDPWERLRQLRAALPNTVCKCCCGARTCWATATTATMWSKPLSLKRPLMASTYSASLMP